MKRGVWIALAVTVFAAGYFGLDVRQRARVDRGLKRHRTDFTVYQAAARALRDGEDPYAARNPRGYLYVYPPLLAVLLQPIADWRPENGALVFFVVSALFLIAALLALMRVPLVRGAPPLGFVPVAVAGLVCLGFAHQGFQRGQVTHVLLGMQVLALADLARARYARAGLWLGVAGALRLTPLLPAAGVGLGLLVAGVRGGGPHAPLRFGAGVAGALLAGFVLVPLLSLGPARAAEVGDRWLEVTEEVYADRADLAGKYRINEWRFKNQAPRRVIGTWTGWALDAPFDGERPVFQDARTLERVDTAASVTTWALLALALLASACWLRAPGTLPFAVAFAALVLLPVLMTRYAWPTHYLMALPAVALAARRHWTSAPVLVFLAGAALFYAAHARTLQPLGEAGCLLLAAAAFLALLLAGLRAASRRRERILARFAEGGVRERLYRALRLRFGGFEALAARLPARGRIVDLGAGAGLLAHVLVDAEGERAVRAVDHAAGRVERLAASAADLPIEAVQGDLRTVDLPPCEGIALVDVLHYLDEDEQARLLARCAAALRADGVLVLRDPDAGGGLRFRWTRLHERVATGLGWTRATVGAYRRGADWANLLRAEGLEVEVLPLARCSPYADRVVVARKTA